MSETHNYLLFRPRQRFCCLVVEVVHSAHIPRLSAVPKSVMVVDDDLQILGLVEHWLAKAGYEVVTSSHFEDARKYLAAHHVDALITDLRLGEYNGLQLALRASQMEPKAAVLVMSAFDDVVSRRDAASCGGRFMLKPIERESMLTELADALLKAVAV